MRSLLKLGSLSLITTLALLAPGCGSDSSPTGGGGGGGAVVSEAPSNWIGRYAGTTDEGPCIVPIRTAASSSEPDTFSICDGDAFRNEEELIDCTATWSANELDFSCSASFFVAGCTISTSASGTAVLDGDELTFDANIETSSTGPCGGDLDQCFDVNAVYNRISTTPVESECGDVSFDEDFPELGSMSMRISDGSSTESFEAIMSAVRIGGSLQLVGTDASFLTRGGAALNRSLQIYIGSLPDQAVPFDVPVGVECQGCASVNYQEILDFELFGAMDATDGTVRITQLTDDEVAGTFSFSGALAGDLSGNRTVTNGTFGGPLESLEDVGVAKMRTHMMKHLRGK